jgi:hypothetical protein
MEESKVETKGIDDVRLRLSKTSDIFLKTAAIIAGVTALAGGYAFFLNYVWKPKVEVVRADYDTGTATIRVGTLFLKTIDISGDTIYQLSGDWGVRFGSVFQSGKTVYNRIELVRKGMVVEYLKK